MTVRRDPSGAHRRPSRFRVVPGNADGLPDRTFRKGRAANEMSWGDEIRGNLEEPSSVLRNDGFRNESAISESSRFDTPDCLFATR